MLNKRILGDSFRCSFWGILFIENHAQPWKSRCVLSCFIIHVDTRAAANESVPLLNPQGSVYIVCEKLEKTHNLDNIITVEEQMKLLVDMALVFLKMSALHVQQNNALLLVVSCCFT